MNYIPRRVTIAGEETAIISLTWASKSNAVVQLELHNDSADDSISVNKIGAVRGDLLEADTVTGESDAVKNGAGVELCTENWLEVRKNSGDSWHPVDGYANAYDIGAIGSFSSKTFEVRLNVPSSISSVGSVSFAIRVLSR